MAGQGLAFAGMAAAPLDASTLYYNPAGLSALADDQGLVTGVSLLAPSATFRDVGSTAGISAGPFAAYSGTGSRNPFAGVTPVPHFYAYVTPEFSPKLRLGLAVTAPFGLGVDYDEGWIGRYDSTETDLRTLDIAPGLSLSVTDRLSLGFGIDIQHAKARLERALPCPTAICAGTAFTPGTDGISTLRGQTVSFGYNAGALYKMTDRTQLGLSYRSAITHDMDGTATVAGLSGPLAAQNGERGAKAKLKLPDIVNIGLQHTPTDRLRLMAGYSWFGWSNYDEIRIRFDTGGPDSVTPQNYRDSFAVAAGAEWDFDDRWLFRTGLQYDKTPTNDTDRSTLTPDGDRLWLSVGGQYKTAGRGQVDFALTHIAMENGDIHLTKPFYTGTGVASTVNLRGNTDNHVNILSLGWSYRF